MKLTQSYLRSILNYDKGTGIFTWKVARARNVKVGDVAGSKSKEGYLTIGIRIQSISKLYKAHRLAWLYEYGEWPNVIDHVNRITSDNKISNLRDVSQLENIKNSSKYKNNKSGITGVSLHKQANKWRATIKINGKTIHLGLFEDKNEAICARLHANRMYKFHANHGKNLNLTEQLQIPIKGSPEF